MNDALDVTIKKAARRLLWFLNMLLLFAVIDRGNIGYAALTMNESLGLTVEMVGYGGGLFLLGYLLFDIPSNLLLARFGARTWLTRIALTWGLATALLAFVGGPRGFYVLRFSVGVAEAGCLPGIVYLLAQWFPQSHRGRYTSAIMLAIPLANALAPLLAAGVMKLDGSFGLDGWRWLFLVEGAITCCVGMLVWLYLTDKPADAAWLQPSEREILTAAIAREVSQHIVHRSSVKRALTSPGVLALALAYAGINIQMNFSSLWFPQIFRAYRTDDAIIAVLTALPFVCGTISMLFWSRRSDLTGKGYLYVLAATSIATAAWTTAAVTHSIVMIDIAFAAATSGVFVSLAIFWTFPPRLLTGLGAAAALGLISAIGQLGSAIATPFVGRFADAAGWSTALMFVAGVSLITPVSLLLFRRQLAPSVVNVIRGTCPGHLAVAAADDWLRSNCAQESLPPRALEGKCS